MSLHLAAKKAVGESVEKPLLYWDENVGGMRSLLQACLDEGVDRVLFSSSAAVFGNAAGRARHRGDPGGADESRTARPSWSASGCCATSRPRPAALGRAALLQRRRGRRARAGRPQRQQPGADDLPGAHRRGATRSCSATTTDTRDGSCIRDYIHVVDLAEAHAAAAARLDEGPIGEVYNVGRGEGVTVKEVFATVREVTGIDFTVDVVGRRPG